MLVFMSAWHGVASCHPALLASREASWKGSHSCSADRLRSYGSEPCGIEGRAGWYFFGLEHYFALHLVQRSVNSLWTCSNEHTIYAKHSGHLVALYTPFAFSLWTGRRDCLRSPGPAPGLFCTQSQGCYYPLFLSDAIPSGTHYFSPS